MMRRQFIGALGVAAAGTALPAGLDRSLPADFPERDPPHRSPAGGAARPIAPGSSVEEWRAHFPALRQEINGHPLTYLDTAATALRPNQVIDAIADFYRSENANPGAALHTLARRANASYEGARATVARAIGSADAEEIVFTRGTTEGLNLVAATWGAANVRAGDEILVGIAEHASNMLPWQTLAERTGATIRYFAVDPSGHPVRDDIAAKVSPRTRVVAFSHVSNVLGMINPAREMANLVRAPGRIVVLDGAQSVPHVPVDVRELGCDFLAFSSHKMCGPMGVGVLWGKRELLDTMPWYQSGSNMAHDVDVDSRTVSPGAHKFGAGTPNVSGPVGLAAAIDFLRGIGFDALVRHERAITARMMARLAAVPGVRLLGSADAAERVSVFAFTVQGRTPPDVLRALDSRGIAVRAGDLAARPLLRRMGVTVAARASCYLYTTLDEVDRFADALEETVRASR